MSHWILNPQQEGCPNPNSLTKQGSKIGHSVRGDVLCVVSLVGRHSTCEVSACPHIMDEGSYMCHNCQGSGSLALGPSCSSMLYVAGLVTALRGGAPMVGAIPALVRSTDADILKQGIGRLTSGSCQICLLIRGVTNQGGRAGEQETRPP